MAMPILRQWWEETSYQIERLQANPVCADQERKNIFQQKEPTYRLTFKPEPTSAAVLKSSNKPKVAILREEGSNGDREMASAFYAAGFEPWDVAMTDLIEDRISLDQFRGLAAVGGFSYKDVPESAKGWAASIRFHAKLKKMFDDFYNRPDTFSLGVCNGCQLFALLGWVPGLVKHDNKQPRFIKNLSGRFESRWATVRIYQGPSIMLENMAGSVLGIWIAHGEGRLHFPDHEIMKSVMKNELMPMSFVDDRARLTEKYPFNPNGSQHGMTALCSPDGRHLAMMPHPERAFLKWQWPWMTAAFDKSCKASPWLKMFQNAREWCDKN